MLLKKPSKFPVQIRENIATRIKENKITKLVNQHCLNCGRKSLNELALFCRNCGYLFENQLKES